MHTPDESTIILRVLARLEDRLKELAPSEVPRLLTLDQAAEYLAMSTDTVRRLCDRRQLSYVQTGRGGAKRIPEDALREWVDTHSTRRLAQ